MISDGFPMRLGILLGLMGLGLLWDRRLPPAQRHRHRDYGLILIGGVIGAGLGILVDAVSVRVGPEFHLIAKGLEPGPGLHAAALRLGAEAGAVGGIIAGSILVFAVGGRRSPRWHVHALVVSAGATVSGGLWLWGIQATWPFLEVTPVVEILDPAAANRFHLAWAIHIGAYAGALIGLAVMAWRGRREVTSY